MQAGMELTNKRNKFLQSYCDLADLLTWPVGEFGREEEGYFYWNKFVNFSC